MARLKGSRMTEEAKAVMRAKRQANKMGRESAFVTVWDNLKFLNYKQLEDVDREISRIMIGKVEEEKKELLKEKKRIEAKLATLADMNKTNI